MKKASKTLSELLAGVAYTILNEPGVSAPLRLPGASVALRLPEKTWVTAVTSDSRAVESGALFVAINGGGVDGHMFIEQAIQLGCSAIIVERGRGVDVGQATIPIIETDDSREALALVSATFFDHPAQKLVCIGITGTNGKTTTSYLVEEIVTKAGGSPGVIGTVNYRYDGQEFSAPFTTPEPVLLHSTLQEMLASGVTHVIMEVSSHALVQKRVVGIKFDVATFTNLSRDHLDFHGDMEEYFQAKKNLFTENLAEDGKAVLFCEKPSDTSLEQFSGQRLAEELQEEWATEKRERHNRQVITCGFGDDHDLQGICQQYSLQGTKADLVCFAEKIKITSPLVGMFNLKNIITATAVGFALNFSSHEITEALNSHNEVPGRLERIKGVSGPHVYVDYAHTPDALENVLAVLKELDPRRLIVVFGCGGDRDQGKRSLMGEVAGQLADLVIITTDNPRSESPEKIISEIEAGVVRAGKVKFHCDQIDLMATSNGYSLIASRREAIALAIQAAHKGDVVLIAGKGHEVCQIVQGEKFFFDDRKEAFSQLNVWEKDAHDC